MAEFKLLEVPMHYKPMSYSLGFKGITALHGNQYTSRYTGLSNLEQRPTTGFHPKSKPCSPSNLLKRKIQGSSKSQQHTRRAPEYRINARLIRNRISGMVNNQSGTKHLYFWTITFPRATADEITLLLLNKWLTRLRQENMLRSYLWVAERQQNGTIHYHIAIPHRMQVQRANRYMRASIMHSIGKGEINWNKTDAAKYNGVDIAKHRATKRVVNFAKGSKKKSLEAYLTKYITKNDKPFKQLAWHCSRDFSNVIYRVNLTLQELISTKFGTLIDRTDPFTTEHITFYKWKFQPPRALLEHMRFAQLLANTALGS